MKEFENKKKELNESEMENVAGGQSPVLQNDPSDKDNENAETRLKELRDQLKDWQRL
ncbi:MAG: hypothetical protein IKE04_02220 [Oscillospiraceae bacterium]|nr:hypothetical protein [Oscillospiraceae bacterium]